MFVLRYRLFYFQTLFGAGAHVQVALDSNLELPKQMHAYNREYVQRQRAPYKILKVSVGL